MVTPTQEVRLFQLMLGKAISGGDGTKMALYEAELDTGPLVPDMGTSDSNQWHKWHTRQESNLQPLVP